MTLDELVAALAGSDGDGCFDVEVSENWTQGRTVFGGMTAALGLASARRALPDLAPLRSAQVAFVGPLPARVRFAPRLLRRGRSSAFVRVDAIGEDGVGAAMTFVFASERESAISAPIAPKPASLGAAMPVPESVRFLPNFDHWFVSGEPNLCDRFIRLKQPSEVEAEIELLLTADVLPPPILFEFPAIVPLSTMSWQIDLLSPARRSQDRRWRLRNETEMHERGLSTDTMQVWDGDGRLQAAGRQTVAIFG